MFRDYGWVMESMEKPEPCIRAIKSSYQACPFQLLGVV